jgi:hypothetical protein
MRGVFVADSSVPKRFRNGEGLLGSEDVVLRELQDLD